MALRKRKISKNQRVEQTALVEVLCERCGYPVLIDGRFDTAYCDRCTQYRVMKYAEDLKTAKEAKRAGK